MEMNYDRAKLEQEEVVPHATHIVQVVVHVPF